MARPSWPNPIAVKKPLDALQQKFQAGLNLHRQGKLSDAAKLCEEIIFYDRKHFGAHLLLGIICGENRQFERAVEFLSKATKLNPKNAEAHFNCGIALKELKRYEQALLSYDAAISLKHNYHEAYYNRGIVHLELSRFEDALASNDRAIFLKPDFAEAYNNRGMALKELKRLDEALANCDIAIKLKPNYAVAHNNRGFVLKEAGRRDEALASYNKAVELKPDYAEAYGNRGIALWELERLDEALASYNKAIEFRPDFAEAYSNRGMTLWKLKRLDEALASYNKAVELKPDYAEAYSNRGMTLWKLKRLDEALASCNKAIELKPDYAEAYGNRGIALWELKRLNEALASYDRAISLNPEFSEAHNNRGNVLKELKGLDAAQASYDRAIALKPDYAEAYWNKSLCLLLRGEFSEGWQYYDWRWKIKEFTSKPLSTDKPVFRLQDSKRVLVWTEQGIGDEIMFASTIEEFRNLCAKLIVQVDTRLIPLFSRSISQDVLFFPKNSTVPQDLFDQQISIGSIGKYLRNDEASFIQSRFGYLIADSERTNEIKSFLHNKNRRKICGISWRSENEKTGDRRSLTLNSFLRLLFMEEYAFVSLQYGDTEEELIKTRAELGIDVISYGQVDNFKDLDGLASLIQACDVVVSVDNTTVHLAGALGKDVRILLPDVPDWRWQLDRKDSPWYSSATLYRQSADGDWVGAFSKIKSDLQKKA